MLKVTYLLTRQSRNVNLDLRLHLCVRSATTCRQQVGERRVGVWGTRPAGGSQRGLPEGVAFALKEKCSRPRKTRQVGDAGIPSNEDLSVRWREGPEE